MSLTTLIREPDVAARLNEFCPKVGKLREASTRAEPLTRRYALVGTAFDYALRFELQRRNPRAVTRPWVCEHAPARIRVVAPSLDTEAVHRTEALVSRAEEEIRSAKRCVASYVKRSRVTRKHRTEMAAHTLRLAKLDAVFRSGYIDDDSNVDPDDVSDVIQLMDIAPFDTLAGERVLYLNPSFNEYSVRVGGADADLITGDTLIEIKTTKAPEIKRETLRQLIGYLILARAARRDGGHTPEIHMLAVYLSRQGFLWRLPCTKIVEHEGFLDMEQWFLQRAASSSMA